MRINVYAEELLLSRDPEPKSVEIVWTKYVSSRTGEVMKNWGLRIYTKSHLDLHYIPGRDDDRSAVTFWCGPAQQNVFDFIDLLRYSAEQSNLELFREKVQFATAETEKKIGETK